MRSDLEARGLLPGHLLDRAAIPSVEFSLKANSAG